MKNKYVKSLSAADPRTASRVGTDKLFTAPSGSFDYRGRMDHAVRFIEDFQLLDTALWAKFVNVFTERPRLDSTDRGWRGEYWGKMMRGACITYQYTQNPALYRVLTKTVEDMLGAPEEDGRISSYERENEFDGWDMWCRKYVMLGLEYFLEICTDSALSDRILKVVCGQADYILAHIGEGKLDITKTTRAWQGVNSSSVLEPIVRLYNLTGEQRYLDFATYIVKRGAAENQNLFEEAYENKTAPHEWQVIKAYEIMSCFEGLLEYYRVTGIEKWKTAALNFGKKVYEHEVSIIGSCGCWHELFDNAAKRQLTTVYTGIMQETCVTVTWMKLCLQLLCLSGDSRYADEIERSAYNAMIGAINFDRTSNNNGFPFDSYSPLLMGARGRYVGGHKILSDGSSYGCCACIGSAGTGLIPGASMLLREDGVAVNLYLSGTAAIHTPDGSPLEITVKTNYPLNGAISLTLNTTSTEPFTLALRIPAWSKQTTLAVNTQMVDVTPGAYTEITRVWTCGDTVELFLDMRTEVLHPGESGLPDANSKYHVALRRGPLVLARDSRLSDDLRKPVAIDEDHDGYAVEVLPAKAPDGLDCTAIFHVKQTDGTYLEVMDYASAGRTRENRSLMSAWMHTRDYLPFDAEKPFELMLSCYRVKGLLPFHNGDLLTKSHMEYKEDGKIYSPANDTALIVTIEDRKGDTCHLRVINDGRYLSVDQEGFLTLSKKGTPLTLHWQGHNCYSISDPDGRWLEYKTSSEQTALFFDKRSLIPRNLFDFVNVE